MASQKLSQELYGFQIEDWREVMLNLTKIINF